MNVRNGSIFRFGRVLIALLLFAAFSVASFKPALAANAVVGGACGEAEFEAALTTIQSGGGGTMTFNCGNSPFYIYFSSVKTINTAVAIEGGGQAILSGQNSTRLFNISNLGSLTLTNITVRNGNGSGGDGGAIYNQGSLTVDNSKFLYNTTDLTKSGGAIVSYGPLTIQNNSEFAYNEAGGGGAVYPRWGAALTQISNSSFHHNHASSLSAGYGGALLAWDGPQVTISGSTFDQNRAECDGGAIFILVNSALTMSGSQLTSNVAQRYGGAVFIQGSAYIQNTVIAWNYALDHGGGIGNEGTATLISNVLKNNESYGGNGGGIYNAIAGFFIVIQSTFSENGSDSSGGAIMNYGLLIMENSQMLENNALYGSGIFSEGITDINFSNIVEIEGPTAGFSMILKAPASTFTIKLDHPDLRGFLLRYDHVTGLQYRQRRDL